MILKHFLRKTPIWQFLKLRSYATSVVVRDSLDERAVIILAGRPSITISSSNACAVTGI